MSSTVDILQCGTPGDLAELLAEHDVPLRRWGRKGAKTVEQLFEEMQAGESRLTVDQGRLLRTVDVVNVVVEHKNLRLVEEEIRLPGGITRRRQFPWVSEKLIAGEKTKAAARRALREELGIDDPALTCKQVLRRCTDTDSGAYPGLACRFLVYQMNCELPDRHFNPDGYIEDDGDKQVIFRWRPKHKASLKPRARGARNNRRARSPRAAA